MYQCEEFASIFLPSEKQRHDTPLNKYFCKEERDCQNEQYKIQIEPRQYLQTHENFAFYI